MKKAASAKKTNARGDSTPNVEAELGALVEAAEAVAELVFEAVDVELVDVVLEPVEVVEPEVVLVELPVDVVEDPVEVVEPLLVEEPVDDEPVEVEDAAEEVVVTPPIS